MVPLLLLVITLVPVAIRFLFDVKSFPNGKSIAIMTSCCFVCCIFISCNEKIVGVSVVNGFTILIRQQPDNNHHQFNNQVQSVAFTRRRQQQQQQRSSGRYSMLSLSQSNKIESSVATTNDNNDENSSATTIIQSENEDIATRMEQVVLQYFQGVQEKDPIKIRSCFNETAIIRDVCSLSILNKSNSNTECDNKKVNEKIVSATILVQRCIDFVTAHPDVQINFYYGPICDKTNTWVFVHWYESGTWSQSSCNISPPPSLTNNSMYVEGQTRFRVNPISFKIEEFIITRTYTEWERTLLSPIA